MYNYWGFGLSITSEIEFPELLPFKFTGGADINIIIGIAPQVLTGDNITHKVGVSISPTQYLAKFLNIANYYASNGNTIVIEPLAGSDERSIRLFLLGNVMAALLHQRDAVILHASVIEYRDSVVLFCGPTNIGKTTLLVKMQQKGYKVFSDNYCLIKMNEEGFCEAMPSYPMINLWEDTFEKLEMPIPTDTHKIRPQLPKYGISYHDKFSTLPKPVKHIFILGKQQHNKQTVMTKMSAVEAFSEVHNNILHRLQIYPMKKQAVNFSVLSKLTSNIPTHLVSQKDHEDINEICALVETTLQANK
jgi:hypothetical protein